MSGGSCHSLSNGAIGGIVSGAAIGVLLVMALLALFVLNSRKSKFAQSEAVGAPEFDAPVVPKTAGVISGPRDDIEVSHERVPPADSGRLQSDDGLSITSEFRYTKVLS
jgi:hypothetical protein